MDETQKTEGSFSPKHFFLQLGSLVSLYASVSLFLVLVYAVINKTVGDALYYSSDESAMRFAIAGLVVLFPIYVIISRVIGNMYRANPAHIGSNTKKWITSFTLFVTGAVLAGDLFAVIYAFLEGSTTASFILKALSVFVVLGTTFWYYLQDIKRTDYTNKKISQYYAYSATAALVVFVIVGFLYVGSPVSVTKEKNDAERINDLSSIQYSLTDYWQNTGKLPESLDTLKDPLSGRSIPVDPNGKAYSYTKTGDTTFTLCAVFETESDKDDSMNSIARYPYNEEFFAHGVGETCFERTIDTNIYPIRKN